MTSEELVDARLYRQQRCFICEQPVHADEGSRWRYFRDGHRRHLYLHDECGQRVRNLYGRAVRRRYFEHESDQDLLPALRAMRSEVSQ